MAPWHAARPRPARRRKRPRSVQSWSPWQTRSRPRPRATRSPRPRGPSIRCRRNHPAQGVFHGPGFSVIKGGERVPSRTVLGAIGSRSGSGRSSSGKSGSALLQGNAGHDQVPAPAGLFVEDDFRLAGQGLRELRPEEAEIGERGCITACVAQRVEACRRRWPPAPARLDRSASAASSTARDFPRRFRHDLIAIGDRPR